MSETRVFEGDLSLSLQAEVAFKVGDEFPEDFLMPHEFHNVRLTITVERLDGDE